MQSKSYMSWIYTAFACNGPPSLYTGKLGYILQTTKNEDWKLWLHTSSVINKNVSALVLWKSFLCGFFMIIGSDSAREPDITMFTPAVVPDPIRLPV